MKAYPTLIMLVLMNICSCGKINRVSDDSPNILWGEPSNGFRCRLSSPLTEYTIPGILSFVLEIENITQNDITLAYEPIVCITEENAVVYTAPYCELYISKLVAKEYPLNISPHIKPYAKSIGFGKLTISKNSVWSKEFALNVEVPPELKESFAGTYDVVFILGSSGNNEYWNGHAVSNYYRISISKPRGP